MMEFVESVLPVIDLVVVATLLFLLLPWRPGELDGGERVELDALRNENSILELRRQRACSAIRRELLKTGAPQDTLRTILNLLDPGAI